MLRAKRLDVEIFPTYEIYFLLKDEAGKSISVGNIMTDISEQKQVSQQLKQAKESAEEANRAKSQFLANMSHEIRTPLNAIIGYAQLISEENILTGVAQNRFVAIASAGERLLSLINDVLDIARIESGRLVLQEQKMDLCKEVQQIGKLLQGQAEAKGLQFEVVCDLTERQFVWMDTMKFHQVLTNLVGNAIKFTQQGSVKLSVDILRDRIHVCVDDTGPGIEQELMENLFTPFVQGKAGEQSGGTGLGLALASTLVKLMQGQLKVTSTASTGTHILVDLPLNLAPDLVANNTDENAFSVNMRLKTPVKVLVAEDDEWSRDILVSLLEKAGCQVIETQDGEQAWQAFQQDAPDLVLTDIRMPKKTGLELLRAIQQTNSEDNIPVIAVTASTLEHEQRALMEHGFWQVIAKPYQMEDIYRAISHHLEVQFVSLTEDRHASSVNIGAIVSSVKDGVETEQIDMIEQQRAQQYLDSREMTDKDWQALLNAAQNGDVAAIEQEFSYLEDKLTQPHKAALSKAIASFDFGLVERLVAQFRQGVEE